MRRAVIGDMPKVGAALASFEPEALKKGFIGSTSLKKATLSIAQQIREGNGYLVGDYLVMVSELTPWYSEEKILQEWFTIKLTRRAYGFGNIAKCLEEVAIERGCSLVITGDTSGTMARAWQAGGMSPLSQSFYKRVSNYGIRPRISE